MKRVIISLFIVFTLAFLIGCSGAGNDGEDVNPLAGTWSNGDPSLAEEIYEFNTDMSFSYDSTVGGESFISYSGTYSYTDTELDLSYTWEGYQGETTYEYQISGNTLTLTDPSDDTSTEYTKQ